MGYISRGAVTGTQVARPYERGRRAVSLRLGGALAGILIPLSLVAAGCSGTASSTPSATESSDLPSVEPSATPGSTELLKLSGKGDKESPEFHASGLSVDVKFDYKCSPENSFSVNFYGAGASPEMPDVITDEYGATRSDTVNEPLNNSTGPFHVEITTQCEWSVTVLGSK